VGVFDMFIPAKTQVLKANNPCQVVYMKSRPFE
jgi:hypothetical protein